MYIPRPAKFFFQIDDGRNQLLIKHGSAVPEWTTLVIERMLACAIGIRRYSCDSPDCIHTKCFYQSSKSKGCSVCGMKATGQWIAEQQHMGVI
ncbi:MAG: transposase zinc-binding domain-containing protein [Morganella sp. (in: enterobacteria)]